MKRALKCEWNCSESRCMPNAMCFESINEGQYGVNVRVSPIIMISAMTRLCLDAQAPPNSGGAAMMVGGVAMMVGGVQ